MKNMKKNITKINEAQLRKVVAKSIKKALREDYRDDEPMRAKIPSRVMPSATVAPGNHDLHNPFVLGTKQIRSATDAAQKMNQIVQKFVYEAEEAQEPWTIQSLSQEIFNKFSKINGFEYGKPHVYEFTLDNIQKRIKLYINKVRNNLWYFEEGGNGKIVAESVKSCDDFYNYVIKRFNEEGVEVGDAGEKIVISESKLRKIIASVIKEHLNERGTNLAKRTVDEMAYPVGFNMKTLISLPSFAKRLQYCKQYLKKIGAGSSRVVFAVDNEKVLKVAKNGKGIAQNQEEMQDWRQNYYDCFAKVYDASEDGIFLEMQAARRAKDSDFRKLTGYGFDVMSAWIGYTASLYTPRNRMAFRDHNFDELFDSEEWAEGLDNYNLFSRVHSYLCDTCSEAYGDLQRLSSWGVVSENGEESLVIIDFGLTEEIFDNYYRRKVQQ